MSDVTPSFVGVVQDGKVHLDSPKQFAAYAKRFEGDEIEVEIRKRRKKRSDVQNRYWHGVVIPLLAEHTGYTRDEMHEALKAKFLGSEDLALGLVRIGSTTKLSTEKFADLVDQVVLWAAESLGVIIPLPDKNYRQKRGRAA